MAATFRRAIEGNLGSRVYAALDDPRLLLEELIRGHGQPTPIHTKKENMRRKCGTKFGTHNSPPKRRSSGWKSYMHAKLIKQ